MSQPSFVIDLKGCARCDADGHKDLKFTRFRLPVIVSGRAMVRYSHWAICPTTGEPILYAVLREWSSANIPAD